MCELKHLLPPVKKYFKASLHTHSTVSDGKLTPQEVKDAYKAKGYQVLALTDHNVIVDHSHMNEPDFLMLTGAEFNVNEENYQRGHSKSAHFNFIAKRPDNLWQPFRYAKEWNAFLERGILLDERGRPIVVYGDSDFSDWSDEEEEEEEAPEVPDDLTVTEQPLCILDDFDSDDSSDFSL